MKTIAWFSVLFILFSIQSIAKDANRVISLKNDKIEVVILADVGGRVVFFGKPGGENFLFADTTQWNEPVEKRIVPTPETFLKQYNGFITWAGPQSLWWNQQSVNPKRKNAVWPPDPYVEFGTFTIENQTATSITITGPVSPISGLQLTKTFELNSNRLDISVTAKNCRNEQVAWDLWSNLRFDAFTQFSVPVKNEEVVRLDEATNNFKEPVPHQQQNGYFTFLPAPATQKMKVSKAFIYPSEGKITVKKPYGIMTINFELIDRSLIHPEQALVEVYNCISADGRSNILELEHHSAFKTLQPGKSMVMEEAWILE